ncbi:hypothetical protein [uncultured Winogradskyella sp.]|uniref:hypothetical protein n=1 Tax=uncultured Winogradskyella sp. TaxID=395353 RepID=UPI00261D9F30|nr:hypothetical protein [uncultured Winogradskyella sp.]
MLNKSLYKYKEANTTAVANSLAKSNTGNTFQLVDNRPIPNGQNLIYNTRLEKPEVIQRVLRDGDKALLVRLLNENQEENAKNYALAKSLLEKNPSSVQRQQLYGLLSIFAGGNRDLAFPAETRDFQQPVTSITEDKSSISRRAPKNISGPSRATDSRGEARTVPKDLTVVPETMHMTFKGGERAQVTSTYIEQMALVGIEEGFSVTVLLRGSDMDEFRHYVSKEALTNIKLIPSESVQDEWAEDSGDFDVQGNIHMPFPNEVIDPGPAIKDARDQRDFYFDPRDKSDGEISLPGKVVTDKRAQQDKYAIAFSEKRDSFKNISHIEGGNILHGTTEDGQPYALVGRDGVALTQQLLAHKEGVSPDKISQEQVREVIARDYGVHNPRNIHFIEQPGEFHLDMSMVLMRQGQVILNDALMAFNLQKAWLIEDYQNRKPSETNGEAMVVWKEMGLELNEELLDLEERARKFAQYENRSYEDLRRAGLEVVRVAGAFPPTRTLPKMNFLNGEGGLSSKDGMPFFITNGSIDPRAESYIADQYLNRLHTGIERLYFLDPAMSEASLTDMGGAGCRTKASGQVGELPELDVTDSMCPITWGKLGFQIDEMSQYKSIAAEGLSLGGIDSGIAFDSTSVPDTIIISKNGSDSKILLQILLDGVKIIANYKNEKDKYVPKDSEIDSGDKLISQLKIRIENFIPGSWYDE